MDNYFNINELAKMVKEKRGERGYRKAAKEMNGVTHACLHSLETKLQPPTLMSYLQICIWLGVPMDYFTYRYQNNISITDKNTVIRFLNTDDKLDKKTATTLTNVIEMAYTHK